MEPPGIWAAISWPSALRWEYWFACWSETEIVPRLLGTNGAPALARFIAERILEPGGCWQVGGPEVLTGRDVAVLAEAAAGRRVHRLTIAPGIVRGVVAVVSRFSPHLGGLAQFVVDASGRDAVGPIDGVCRLWDHYRHRDGIAPASE